MEEILPENIKRKAYEIAYALGRVGDAAEGPLGKMLKRKGFQILDAVCEPQKKNRAEDAISAANYFIKLGAGLGSIGQGNVDLLLEEMGVLSDMLVKETSGKPKVILKAEDIDLSDIFADGFGNEFSKIVVQAPPQKKENEIPFFLKSLRGSGDEIDEDDNFAGYSAKAAMATEEEPAKEIKEMNDKDDVDIKEEELSGNEHEESQAFSPLSSNIRQSSILNKIRQSGNCRMKDLQDIFPQYSERTIRYDLESLIRKKLVERIGAGSTTAYKPILAKANTR